MNKLIFIGIDGMDPKIAEQMMNEGQLPNFARLASQGNYKQLATLNPAQSPVVWSTISTGVSPGEHGIFDFILRDPATYKPYLSLQQIKNGKYINPVKASTFWENVVGEGLGSIILKWPMGFPPRPFTDGRMLAGLGVPDIRGMMGTYTFFTTAPEIIPAGHKGNIIKIIVQNNKVHTGIPGPFVASSFGRKETHHPLSVEISNNFVNLNISRQSFKLHPGEWSAWIKISFDIGFFNKTIGYCRFYLKSIKPDFKLYMTPVQVDFESDKFPIATPLNYASQLRDVIGPYATLGISEDTNALNDGVLDEDEFLAFCSYIMDERERMFEYEFTKYSKGILACVFDTTDRIQHMFWRAINKNHHLYTDELNKRYGHIISDYYKRMDKIIGGIINRISSDTILIICSDHGFTSFEKEVHLNTWLVQNGFMAFKKGKCDCDGLFECVDWAETTAYAVGFTSLYINIKGREINGSVDAVQVQFLKAKLKERLLALTENGKQVIENVYSSESLFRGKEIANAPDLIIGYSDKYRGSWQTAIGGVPKGAIITDNMKKWSGDHCCDASFVPGIFFCNKKEGFNITSVSEISSAITKVFKE